LDDDYLSAECLFDKPTGRTLLRSSEFRITNPIAGSPFRMVRRHFEPAGVAERVFQTVIQLRCTFPNGGFRTTDDITLPTVHRILLQAGSEAEPENPPQRSTFRQRRRKVDTGFPDPLSLYKFNGAKTMAY